LRARLRRPGHRRAGRAGVHAPQLPGRGARVPAVLRQRAGVRARAVAGGVHRADAADRRQPAGGHRQDPDLPRALRRLPAAAVPDGPRRPAAEDRAGAAGPARRDRSRATQGTRRQAAGARAGRAHPRVAEAEEGVRVTTIAVVTAGLSQPSSTRLLADQLAAATRDALGGDAEVKVVELRDIAVDVTNNMLTGFPSPKLSAAIDTVTAADALIA